MIIQLLIFEMLFKEEPNLFNKGIIFENTKIITVIIDAKSPPLTPIMNKLEAVIKILN